MSAKTFIVAITGASGGGYVLKLLKSLDEAGTRVHVVASPHGRQVLADECGIHPFTAKTLLGRASPRLRFHACDNLSSPLASGSFRTAGMVICPCSSNTLGKIASGLADNLVTRAAHVTLKEARRLVLVHREMPVSAVDLKNMLTLAHAGAVICPASPGFYMHPQSVGDLIDFVVGRILDLLDVPHRLNVRFGE